MNKTELLEAFPTVAPSAARKIDDEWRIVGKYCEVAYLGHGAWDLWIHDTKDLREELPPRKLNAILQKLREEATFTELTGEAYASVQGTGLIENNLDLLGIKRRRRLSQEERIRRRELIVRINATKNERLGTGACTRSGSNEVSRES